MRLGTKSSDDFIQLLNEKSQTIQELFQKNIENLTKTVTIKAMRGDSTITDQKTFDPMLVQNFYNKIIKNLPEWTVQDISISNNEDLRRVFVKFEIIEGNYLLSGHLSLQYHVLLFYKPDNRVVQCQKELSEIIDKTKNTEEGLASDSDQFILKKLKDMGYTNLDHQNLFEVFYENDEMREKIFKDIEEMTDVDLKSLAKRKLQLFDELDNLLIETYQTTSVLIDDTRLIAGEEGCLCTFDLEFIKNKIKEGVFDPKKMSPHTKEVIIDRLDQIIEIMKV